MSATALCVAPPSTRNARVRKNLSRSASECDFHPRSRQKPRSQHGSATDLKDSASSEQYPLPDGLLSCLSMLELTMPEDEAVDPHAQANGDSFGRHSQRAPSRNGSFRRSASSSGSMADILNRIRVPSQRMALEEVMTAAERVEAHLAARGRTPSWCSPSLSCASDRSPTPLLLEAAQLDAVLRAPPSPSLTSCTASGIRRGNSMTRLSCPRPPSLTALRTWHHPSPRQPPSTRSGRRRTPRDAGSRRRGGHTNGDTGGAAALFAGRRARQGPRHVRRRRHRGQRGHRGRRRVLRASTGAMAASAWGGHARRRRARGCAGSSSSDISSRRSGVVGGGVAASSDAGGALVPTAFQWVGAARNVYLCGTFNGWGERISMGRATQPEDWWVVLSLPPGEYAYKFVVHAMDGRVEWRHAADQPSLIDSLGNANNWICVVDQDAYEREGLSAPGAAAAAAPPPPPCCPPDGTSPGAPPRGARGGGGGGGGGRGGRLLSGRALRVYELLFAQEPPPVPAQLLGEPLLAPDQCAASACAPPLFDPHPPNAINASITRPSSTCAPRARRRWSRTRRRPPAYLCPPSSQSWPPPSNHSWDGASALRGMYEESAVNPWDVDVDVADVTITMGPSPPRSPSDVDADMDDGSGAANRTPAMPPPVAICTTFRHRTKYVTVELIKPAPPTRSRAPSPR